ncbi:glycosyltransferase family 4 protein [Acinetobacter schindleri]|uniref:glycosyltransferase family 4 protein n=1 Tax=Acinetobacter schindleri TaxID=108981 RepID=UPI00160C93B1|nr:glycosyltransferase family 4 protein [Acinetobacter schindleri]MBB4835257.1 glycosyltransferase involved in cell wall biosynthesis [Acinetobacter schindleri]
MKKICFLIGNLNHSGGTERVTTLIANALAQENYQISILSLTNGKQPFFELVPSIKTYSLYPEKISFKKNFFGAVWHIRKFVTQHQIDALVVVDSISCIFTVPALFGLRIKHICWEHFNFKNNNGVKLRGYARKLAAKYCDYVVTLTKRDKELWEKGLKKINAKVVVIANPVSYEDIENIPSLEYKTVLTVGRLTHVKGFDLLITAWSKIVRQINGWKVIIVGSGEDDIMLKQMAKDLEVDDSIIFAGQQKNMDTFYRQASFFCMSSRFEGLPMALLEAQSYGLPIVAFDCDTGPAEIVEHNASGFLVEPGNIAELAGTLLEVINLTTTQYEKMSLDAMQNSTKYAVHSIMKLWLSIIK